MTLLTLLTQMLAVVSLLSFAWLLVRAFGKHILWGLGVLLLPPLSAAAFGITYWDEEKKPFLLYLVSTLTALGLMLYLFTAWGGWELLRATSSMQQGLAADSLSARDASSFLQASRHFAEKSGMNVRDPATEARLQEIIDRETVLEIRKVTEETAPLSTDNLSRDSIAKKVQTDPEPRYRLVYRPVSISDARNYIGATMKVTRRNVPEKEYRLVGATANSLRFSQHQSGGTYSFAFRNHDIEKLRVLIKEPY